MVDVKQVLTFMAENTLRTGLPVPAPRDVAYKWAEPLRLPRRGRAYLYTGALYQLVPYINSLVRYLEGLESKRGSGLMLRVARAVSRVVDLSKIAVKPDPRDVEYVNSVLASIARLLKWSGVDYGYLYEDDLYSGAILYDMGLEEAFQAHAERVYKRLKARGAEKVITVDPHTTYVARDVYPKYIDGYSLEVVNYLEILADKASESGSPQIRGTAGDAVIHDPCLYARGLGIIEQPRRLLHLAGIRLQEPRRSGRLTFCCGGPVEALSPALARRIAETRLKELREASKTIVTMCPICYANLSRAARDESITDISLILAKAFLEGTK